nr:hypothetical protein [Actinoplanes sp. TFC3]
MGEYAEVNGIILYYEAQGPGRPLVLLHGGLGAGEMFAPILPAVVGYSLGGGWDGRWRSGIRTASAGW